MPDKPFYTPPSKKKKKINKTPPTQTNKQVEKKKQPRTKKPGLTAISVVYMCIYERK